MRNGLCLLNVEDTRNFHEPRACSWNGKTPRLGTTADGGGDGLASTTVPPPPPMLIPQEQFRWRGGSCSPPALPPCLPPTTPRSCLLPQMVCCSPPPGKLSCCSPNKMVCPPGTGQHISVQHKASMRGALPPPTTAPPQWAETGGADLLHIAKPASTYPPPPPPRAGVLSYGLPPWTTVGPVPYTKIADRAGFFPIWTEESVEEVEDVSGSPDHYGVDVSGAPWMKPKSAQKVGLALKEEIADPSCPGVRGSFVPPGFADPSLKEPPGVRGSFVPGPMLLTEDTGFLFGRKGPSAQERRGQQGSSKKGTSAAVRRRLSLQDRHHKNINTRTPTQDRHHKNINTRTPTQESHHKNVGTRTSLQERHRIIILARISLRECHRKNSSQEHNRKDVISSLTGTPQSPGGGSGCDSLGIQKREGKFDENI